jgi:nucleoside-diphosphate kinase
MSNITFTMLKPDCVEKGLVGEVIKRIQEGGFKIKAMKLTRMTRPMAEGFYAIHKERPFFGELVEFMTRGPIVPMVLEKENAVEDFRAFIGATNPADAAEGTIRRDYADNVGENIIHGSDSDENAAIEANFFFSSSDFLSLEG